MQCLAVNAALVKEEQKVEPQLYDSKVALLSAVSALLAAERERGALSDAL